MVLLFGYRLESCHSGAVISLFDWRCNNMVGIESERDLEKGDMLMAETTISL